MFLETEKAWLACAIDTDGFVGLKKQKVKHHKGGRVYIYNYILGIIGFSNTDPKIVKEFARLIQAKSYDGKENKPYDKKYKASTATTNAKKIKHILMQIMPYLITKKKRAEYVLDFVIYKLDNPGDHSMRSSRNEKDLRWLKDYQEKYSNKRTNRHPKSLCPGA